MSWSRLGGSGEGKEGRSNQGSKGDWLKFPVVVWRFGPPKNGIVFILFFCEKIDFLF